MAFAAQASSWRIYACQKMSISNESIYGTFSLNENYLYQNTAPDGAEYHKLHFVVNPHRHLSFALVCIIRLGSCLHEPKENTKNH
jgi:hypothetical protein